MTDEIKKQIDKIDSLAGWVIPERMELECNILRGLIKKETVPKERIRKAIEELETLFRPLELRRASTVVIEEITFKRWKDSLLKEVEG